MVDLFCRSPRAGDRLKRNKLQHMLNGNTTAITLPDLNSDDEGVGGEGVYISDGEESSTSSSDGESTEVETEAEGEAPTESPLQRLRRLEERMRILVASAAMPRFADVQCSLMLTAALASLSRLNDAEEAALSMQNDIRAHGSARMRETSAAAYTHMRRAEESLLEALTQMASFQLGAYQ